MLSPWSRNHCPGVFVDRNWNAFSTWVGCSEIELRPTRLYARLLGSEKQHARAVKDAGRALDQGSKSRKVGSLAGVTLYDDRIVILLNIEPMKELAKLTGHQHPVNSVAFSPDGNTLATAGDGTHIKLWSREVLLPRTK